MDKELIIRLASSIGWLVFGIVFVVVAGKVGLYALRRLDKQPGKRVICRCPRGHEMIVDGSEIGETVQCPTCQTPTVLEEAR